MDYDAISFDTQTVETNGFHFDGGMLGQLKQFKDGPTAVIISEVVAKEVLKHLNEKTRSAKDAIDSAAKKAAEYGLIASPHPPFLADPIDVKAIAAARLEAFFETIGATNVPVDSVSSRQLIDLYFTPAPPFSASGKKKNEFPDAIALLSLEAWALSQGKKVLAVSGDKDWVTFGEKSEHIDVVQTLEEGLAKLQEHADEANALMARILSGIVSGAAPDLSDELSNLVADEVSGLSVSGEADSAYYFEADQLDLTLQEVTIISDPEKMEFVVVQAGPQIIVARVEADLKVLAEASFSLSIYDSIDKDYVGMGSVDASREENIQASLLITFEGDFESNDIALTQAEIVEAPDTIDFGYIEPDYGEDE